LLHKVQITTPIEEHKIECYINIDNKVQLIVHRHIINKLTW